MSEDTDRASPFKHKATIGGEVVQEDGRRGEAMGTATVDGGGMINVLDWTFYDRHRRRLGPLRPSKARARVANGTIVDSIGRWVGTVEMGPVVAPAGFEVFDSHGSFDILLGKPWLRKAGLVQDFVRDVLEWADKSRTPVCLENQDATSTPAAAPTAAASAPKRAAPSPQRQPSLAAQSSIDQAIERETGMTVGAGVEDVESLDVIEVAVPGKPRRLRGARRKAAAEGRRQERLVLEDAIRRADAEREKVTEALMGVWTEETVAEDKEAPEGVTRWEEAIPELLAVQKLLAPARGSTMTMEERMAPERVRKVLDAVRVGKDLSQTERERVDALIGEYADVFTLSADEVRLVDFIEHRLGVPEGTEGPRVAHQKPLTEPQREWLYAALDEMERNDIVRRIPASAAKWVSAITLAPKDKGKSGMTIDMLRRRANEECVKAGLPPMWVESQDHVEKSALLSQGGNGSSVPPAKAKWRLCHSFIGLNRVSRHNSFPMGDLESKQQRAAGHRWVCVLDFMNGFHAVPVAQEDIAYTAFAIPGRGMYVTPRMCFGLTGAPNTFGEMVATALDGLTGSIVEPWVDDCALWGDEFDELLDKMRRFLQRCRDKKLSLSAVKSELFMTEATFAGARISAAGVQPVLSKVAAVLDWPEPKNAHEVLGFTSLVGHFRALIKDYARIAQPLTDLTRDVRAAAPKGGGKAARGAYKRALERESVTWKWGLEQRHAFAKLKGILTTEPLLKPPQYDRPFIVTTDGSKTGFGATLTQRWPVKSASGEIVEREFPVAYASKRTSRTEEKYSPYLLEFAAMKFSLDKFDKIVFGQPLELVTDCQALRDTLNSGELSATHTRWMEAVIARQIIEIRHRAGKDNQADGLSRKWTSHYDRDVDGAQGSVIADWEERTLEADAFHLTVEGDANDLLRARFADDAYFKDIVDWLTTLNASKLLSPAQAKRARYRARGFVVQDGKLWRVGGKHAHRSPKVECMTSEEGRALAAECHAHGHFGRDLCEESLRMQYFWPSMRRDVVDAIQACSPCKAFGSRHKLTLLEPITRARPFEMVTADYLSLPTGKGGYRTVLLFVDVYTRYVWGYKTTKKSGTGAFTVASLKSMNEMFADPEVFSTDGGSHFDCKEVHEYCKSRGIQYTKTPPYAPWANGLVEETNRTLLGRLRRYCQPDFVEDGTQMSAKEMAKLTPARWPDFLARAIADINSRVLLSLGYTPRELMFGMPLTRRADDDRVRGVEADAETAREWMVATDAMRDDAHARTIDHAAARKAAYDAKVREGEFKVGELVQIYQDRLDNTFATTAKLAARWSGPFEVVGRYLGSWKVRKVGESEGGLHVSGRRLRRWGRAEEMEDRPQESEGRAGAGEE